MKVGLSLAKGCSFFISSSFNINMKAILTNYPGQKRNRFYNGYYLRESWQNNNNTSLYAFHYYVSLFFNLITSFKIFVCMVSILKKHTFFLYNSVLKKLLYISSPFLAFLSALEEVIDHRMDLTLLIHSDISHYTSKQNNMRFSG